MVIVVTFLSALDVVEQFSMVMVMVVGVSTVVHRSVACSVCSGAEQFEPAHYPSRSKLESRQPVPLWIRLW